MKEEFLHYLWKYSLYDRNDLFDSDGNKIEVISPGEYNHDSGPDFFNARIRTAGTVWAGNIEIHTHASHFELHGHQNDPAYNNVILHVVAFDDRKIRNSRGEEIPAAVLRFSNELYEKYEELVNNPAQVACQDYIKGIDRLLLRQWLESLAVERLSRKAESIRKMLGETGNDWEEVFYRMLCRYFGFRVNTEPFEMLSRALPFRIIRKHSDDIFQIESLLFGAAGLLDEGLFRETLSDTYYKDLIREYRILSAKYSIRPIHGWMWKFSRLRPVNFPTIRISQLAHMLAVTGGLFSRVLEVGESSGMKMLFEVPVSDYWKDHYVFGKESRNTTKTTGQQATEMLVINAVIPVIFVYGRSRDRQDICDRALYLLETTPPEQNKILSEWDEAGLPAESAFDSQALIQLRDEYCRKRRCLECRIGGRLVRQGIKLKDEDELMLEP
ncbi:MAG TPA: DUF2851 family protein [Bacteroidales bacterium]|nr:DUF2851 family protein [Bacteroidales bacterium]